MKTYIDAKSLINELSAACMPIYEKGITGILGDNSSIADIINEQPAVDVQEVKHGRWVYKERTKVVNTDNVGILEGYRTITEENIDKATIILKKTHNGQSTLLLVVRRTRRQRGRRNAVLPLLRCENGQRKAT